MSIHTHQIPETKRLQLEKKTIQILRTLPYDKGFHFYTEHGKYTGETATSLDAFEKKIQVVPPTSISFHLQRDDFQKWIKNTIGDDELAKRINLIKFSRFTEDMRRELLEIVQTRIAALRLHLPHHLRHNHS